MADEKIIRRPTLLGRLWSKSERLRREREGAVDAITKEKVTLEKPDAFPSPFGAATIND